MKGVLWHLPVMIATVVQHRDGYQHMICSKPGPLKDLFSEGNNLEALQGASIQETFTISHVDPEK